MDLRSRCWNALTVVRVMTLLSVVWVACGGRQGSNSESPPDSGTDAGDTGDTGGDSGGDSGTVKPTVLLPKSSLSANEIGVLVNTQDPQSVAIAKHYREARAIPAAHVYELSFATGAVLSADNFATVKSTLDAQVDTAIQAYAITWTRPYRVDCMSVTSAFALGFDKKYCSPNCANTEPVPYYASASFAPFKDLGIRPAMAIVGSNANVAKAVIDRGVAADATFPSGDGYFVRTTDAARSVRWPNFVATVKDWSYPEGLKLSYLNNSDGTGKDYIENTKGILYYFTGLQRIPAIDTNTYLPGAVTDHLTSFGGQVPTSSQMSIARWLEAGATGSYGTVVEPCNWTQKFPDTYQLLPRYFRGETLIEAYWKSVRWPGEGLFVGEPLARPWGTQSITFSGTKLTIATTILNPQKVYQIESGPTATGPFDVVLADITIPNHRLTTLIVDPATAAYYILREKH